MLCLNLYVFIIVEYMLYEIFLKIVEFVDQFGYFGLFIMTFIEGTFIPIPSEITLIPAGFLIAKGELNLYGVLFVSILGTVCGALFNYFIAFHFGRIILLKYGKYLFIKKEKLAKIEVFFQDHGPISIFTGRMLPGIKHFISFPAGLGKMNLKLFCAYTTAGATIWVIILIALGYFIGTNDALVSKYVKKINIALLVCVACFIAIYILRIRNKKSKS